MSLFVVDPEKCKRDGVCVAECPAGIIELKNKDAVPTPTADADELCINCGHCVAVCPHGALSHTSMTPDQCAPVRKEWLLDTNQVEHFLRSRRSIRTYKDKQVERELLTKLIDIARFAPSGHNLQPVRWRVIYDSDEVRRLAGHVIDWMRHMLKEQPTLARGLHMDRVVASWESGMERICRGAPHVIVAHAPKEERTAPAACTIALAYLELAVPSFGLGACWAGYFNAAATMWPPMLQALGLPEGHICFGAMMIGYPKYKYHRLPRRNEAQITWR
ncbi:MAG: nitroreductase family protein [Desulfobacteraceae bacterium]|nr:MAG: nitroreductase family protein [Desulfobacteraceae bacterium]